MRKFLILLLLTSIVLSCSKNNASDSTVDGNLIIGLTFGFCSGDCATFYKLELDELYSDIDEKWISGEDPNFNSSPLSNTVALEELMQLEATFPDFLIQSKETRFGCPDCGDWGALHVIRDVDGQRRIWTLDNQIESNPKEIREWAKRMQALILDLIS